MKFTKMMLMAMGACSALAHADIDATLPDWSGGFQPKDYAACQQALKPCQADRFAVTANIACRQHVYATQAFCHQMQAIEAQTGVLPDVNAIHAQGQVTWFSVHHLADGLDNDYMLDSGGRLLGLATSQNTLIAKNPIYQAFMQPYPDGALQSQVTTSASQTPQVRTQSDGSLQLLFSQSLKSQDCVACQPVGVAQLVYYFDDKGRYQAVQIASIDPVTK